jgi:hypothetical protein
MCLRISARSASEPTPRTRRGGAPRYNIIFITYNSVTSIRRLLDRSVNLRASASASASLASTLSRSFTPVGSSWARIAVANVGVCDKAMAASKARLCCILRGVQSDRFWILAIDELVRAVSVPPPIAVAVAVAVTIPIAGSSVLGMILV